jgi:hypothetical protein
LNLQIIKEKKDGAMEREMKADLVQRTTEKRYIRKMNK